MAVTLRYKSQVTTEELPSSSVAPALAATATPLIYTGFDTTQNLTATTTPPVTKRAAFNKTLSAGAATIDLTALTDNGAAVDMSGLKVQCFKVKNKTGNSALTVTFGASNAYLLAGSGWKQILLAGQEFTFYGNDATPDVSGSTKNIDLAGTGTDICEVTIVAG